MDRLCYCTNVHAGPTLELARDNLERFACRTKSLLATSQNLGVGLWLPDQAAIEACQGETIDRFAEWLQAKGLDVFTMNGFPQGNFHQPVVKHNVYLPTWWEDSRLQYTRRLVQILSRLIPDGGVGSISTLPIAWGSPRPSNEHLVKASHHLRILAAELHAMKEKTGKEIVIAIEPEPGCCLGDAGSVRAFFARYLLRGDDREIVRRHITVCHDICHSAVMWEDQGREIQSYFDLGIRIGKVQVSSAIEMRWDEIDASDRTEAIEQLSEFAEDRYLHQTTIRSGPAGSVRLFEDLPKLLGTGSTGQAGLTDAERSKFAKEHGEFISMCLSLPREFDTFERLSQKSARVPTF